MDPFLLVENHSLSRLASDYKKCKKCSHVLNLGPHSSTYTCRICGLENQIPYPFLDLNLLIMVDLMQDSYITATTLQPESPNFTVPVEQARLASVVVYFCTVKELLLHRFISHFLAEFPLPVSFLESWDNHYFTDSQRREELLPSLVGMSWDKLSDSLSDPQNQFKTMSAFLKKASVSRNNLLHEGNSFDIDPYLAKACLENFLPLMEFYARLNNKYVHELRMSSIRKLP